MTAQAPASAPAWHTLSVEDALSTQGVSADTGLSAAEVDRLLQLVGPVPDEEDDGRVRLCHRRR